MSQLPNLFDSYKNASLFPSIDTAVHGIQQAKYGKEPFKVTSYQVKVFDMCSCVDQSEYCKLMEHLMPLCQNAQCVVVKNELQVMGDTWKRYVEWFEYRLNDHSLTTKDHGKHEDAGTVDEPDDSNDSNDTDYDGGIW